jgi:hypothetical protein
MKWIERHAHLLAIGIIAAGLLTLVLWQAGVPGRLERQADSLGGVYSRDTASWAADTLATDSLLKLPADSLHTPGLVKDRLHKERGSAKRAIRTAEQRVTNAEQRVKAAGPGTLRVFGEGTSDLALRAGAVLRIRGFDLQAYAQARAGERPTLNLSLRKEFRLF